MVLRRHPESGAEHFALMRAQKGEATGIDALQEVRERPLLDDDLTAAARLFLEDIAAGKGRKHIEGSKFQNRFMQFLYRSTSEKRTVILNRMRRAVSEERKRGQRYQTMSPESIREELDHAITGAEYMADRVIQHRDELFRERQKHNPALRRFIGVNDSIDAEHSIDAVEIIFKAEEDAKNASILELNFIQAKRSAVSTDQTEAIHQAHRTYLDSLAEKEKIYSSRQRTALKRRVSERAEAVGDIRLPKKGEEAETFSKVTEDQFRRFVDEAAKFDDLVTYLAELLPETETPTMANIEKTIMTALADQSPSERMSIAEILLFARDNRAASFFELRKLTAKNDKEKMAVQALVYWAKRRTPTEEEMRQAENTNVDVSDILEAPRVYSIIYAGNGQPTQKILRHA